MANTWQAGRKGRNPAEPEPLSRSSGGFRCLHVGHAAGWQLVLSWPDFTRQSSETKESC